MTDFGVDVHFVNVRRFRGAIQVQVGSPLGSTSMTTLGVSRKLKPKLKRIQERRKMTFCVVAPSGTLHQK